MHPMAQRIHCYRTEHTQNNTHTVSFYNNKMLPVVWHVKRRKRGRGFVQVVPSPFLFHFHHYRQQQLVWRNWSLRFRRTDHRHYHQQTTKPHPKISTTTCACALCFSLCWFWFGGPSVVWNCSIHMMQAVLCVCVGVGTPHVVDTLWKG